MIEVVNIRNLPGYPSSIKLEEHQVYVGRANAYSGMKQSPLRNPYQHYSARELSISEFKTCFMRVVKGKRQGKIMDNNGTDQNASAGEICDELDRMRELIEKHGKLQIICWCKPLACHGDVIKDYLEGAHREKEAKASNKG